MAAKANMLKLLQEIRGFAQMDNRRPSPRSPVLVLAQMRALATQRVVRRPKLNISITAPTQRDIPHQVRIVHVKASAPAVASPLAP